MLKNKTKNTVIAKRLLRQKGLSKLIGLIGKNKARATAFKTRFGIHTFFLKFPIDVVVVDKDKKVVFIKNGIKPNKIVIWNIKFDTIIELPEGSLRQSKTKKGDILEF